MSVKRRLFQFMLVDRKRDVQRLFYGVEFVMKISIPKNF